jgi:hypothetical protein
MSPFGWVTRSTDEIHGRVARDDKRGGSDLNQLNISIFFLLVIPQYKYATNDLLDLRVFSG